MALSAFGRILLVSRACAVALSVWMGVSVCGWPSSLIILCIGTVILALMNSAPSLASAAEDITALIICNMLSTAPLLVGIFSCPAMNMCPPAWLQAFGLGRQEALLWIASTILLALYKRIAPSWDAA